MALPEPHPLSEVQVMAFTSSLGATPVATYVRVPVTNGTDTFIQLNTDADLAADGTIQLHTAPSGDSVLMSL